MKYLVFSFIAALIGLAACASLTKPDAPTTRKVQTIADNQAVNNANAGAPVEHPVDSANLIALNTVKWLAALTGVLVLALGVGVGLYFTPISYVNTFAMPIIGGALGIDLFGIVAIPYVLNPYIILPLVGGLALYEIVTKTTALASVKTELASAKKGSAYLYDRVESLEKALGTGIRAAVADAKIVIADVEKKLL